MSSSRPPTATDLYPRGIGGMTSLEGDPIVEEIYRVRNLIAEAHEYDLDAIVADMQSRQGAHGNLLVRREPKRVTEIDSDMTPPSESRLARR